MKSWLRVAVPLLAVRMVGCGGGDGDSSTSPTEQSSGYRVSDLGSAPDVVDVADWRLDQVSDKANVTKQLEAFMEHNLRNEGGEPVSFLKVSCPVSLLAGEEVYACAVAAVVGGQSSSGVTQFEVSGDGRARVVASQ